VNRNARPEQVSRTALSNQHTSQEKKMPAPRRTPARTTQPGRLYNYYLSGSVQDDADRIAGEEVEKVTPTVRTMARTNRAFMHRATHYLAEHTGIRQFLDIGSGIPTEPNLHQIVLTHSRDLLTGISHGPVTIMEGDITQPDTILNAPVLHETLDLEEPVALSLISVLHFISDRHHPLEAVSTLLEALAPGSYLTISHSTADFDPQGTSAAVKVYRASGMDPQPRTRAEIVRFFDGLELVAPGIVTPHRWRNPRGDTTGITDADVGFYAACGRKPMR
jgi:hypothetical protein